MAPHSSTLTWKNPMDGGAWKAAVHGVTEGQTQLSDFTFTFHFYALEKEMATHSSVLAWRIPATEKPGGLPSMGSHRIGHDWSDLAAAAAAGQQRKQRQLPLVSCQTQGTQTLYNLQRVFSPAPSCRHTHSICWNQGRTSPQVISKIEVLPLAPLRYAF